MYRKNLDFFRYIAFSTIFGRLMLIPIRFFYASRDELKAWKRIVSYTFFSKEYDNFTYDLTVLNKEHLSHYISCITGISHKKVRMYFREIEGDFLLRKHLNTCIDTGFLRYCTDKSMFYGRRIGWYALVRIAKPKLVIESGVDKGLGACIITAALKRNTQEGKMGRYIGLDINPMSGKLFSSPYTDYGKFICMNSHTYLKKMKEPVDMFIHDSDHSFSHESREYELIKNRLSKDAYVLSDNAHSSQALNLFAAKMNKRFLFFKEVPSNHWYKGAGIGVAW